MSSVLEVEALTKRFGALTAVDDVAFEVEEAEVFGIAGTNGAGKTTLFDVISGHARATAGVVRFAGREIQRLPAYAVCELGLARTYQVASVFPSETVFGNVLVGAFFGHGHRFPTGLRFDAASVSRAEEALDFVGLRDQASAQASVLSALDRKRLMLATALATGPRLLMLDEPAAGLSTDEEEQLVGLIDSVRRSGKTVMVIEHVMGVLTRVSDKIMGMHQGKKIFEGTPAEFQRHPEVKRLYLGVEAGSEELEAGKGMAAHA